MSENMDLGAFLRQKAAEDNERPEVDWNARKEMWLSAVDGLYGQIRMWTAHLVDDHIVTFFPPTSITLSEMHIGDYEIDVLCFRIGKQRIAMYPKGTIIIGASGRVDVRGTIGVGTLVLQDDQWFVAKKEPIVALFPFNEDTFREMLGDVME